MTKYCPTRYHGISPPRGISLLEIMISIGIVGIGLIGVAALIPLAHFKAEQGVREERKALFGKRAFREFFINGFDRPGSFLSVGQGTPYWVWLGGQNPYGIYNGTNGQVVTQTYCFDPLWVAAKANAGIFRGTFPDAGPPAALIPRISVLTYRPEHFRESLMLHGGTPALSSNRAAGFVANPTPMSLVRADQIFRLRDDVVVEPPQDPNDIVRQTYLTESTGTYSQPIAVKRLSSGSFSWMATLVPELKSAMTSTNIALPYATNRYKLSVVVFHQRDVLSNYQEEVVATVMPPPVSMLTGAAKEIVIREQGPRPPIKNNVGVRHITNGDWIALVQRIPMPPPVGSFTRLRWYQVLSTDELESEQTLIRQLSLNGPDWNPDWSTPIFAVYLRNVETVYEKTIELQQ